MADQTRPPAKYGDAGSAPVVVEKTLNAPVAKVWEALTDNTKMKKWYFDLPEFRAEVGFEFQFWGGTEERKYLHLCKIAEVTPLKTLSHTWRYDGYEGNTLVTFALFEAGNKTTVRLTHEGLESFPAGNPDFAKANFEQGWTAIIGSSLREFLEKA